MKFSYDRAWADWVAIMRGNANILLGVGGVFMVLPALVQALLIPPAEVTESGLGGLKQLLDWFSANSGALFLLSLPVALGSAALYALMLDPDRLTVAAALRKGIVRLPALIAVQLMTQFMIVGGLFLLIIPGLYIIGRTELAQPVLMAGRSADPIAAIRQSVSTTSGNGWAITGLIVIYAVVLGILVRAVNFVIGALIAVTFPDSIAPIGLALLDSILAAGTGLTMVILGVAIYRQFPPSSGI